MQASLDTTVAACTIMRHGQQRRATWDIGDWLRGLGLGQYEASFRQNEVNESVLPPSSATVIGWRGRRGNSSRVSLVRRNSGVVSARRMFMPEGGSTRSVSTRLPA